MSGRAVQIASSASHSLTSPVKPVWVDRRRHVVMPTMAGRLAVLSSRSVLDVMLKLTSSPEDCL
jgi:hypothetical protein